MLFPTFSVKTVAIFTIFIAQICLQLSFNTTAFTTLKQPVREYITLLSTAMLFDFGIIGNSKLQTSSNIASQTLVPD